MHRLDLLRNIINPDKCLQTGFSGVMAVGNGVNYSTMQIYRNLAGFQVADFASTCPKKQLQSAHAEAFFRALEACQSSL